MATSSYRFLPFARRGLAARIETTPPGATRASVRAGVTVSSIPEVTRDLALYGPGDVLGIDTRLIVRTSPACNSVDVEPNYLAHVEFDPPDFPWLFTPAGAPADNRLAPWCVLVVVDLDVVAAPATAAGRPLPSLTVPAGAVAAELPDLAESWAWAHVQALTDRPAAGLPAELAANPALNVSRIVAPRRLEPGKRYAACLVPAFDAGVRRGLGADGGTLDPAWRKVDREVVLPVYYHWEFGTGPSGDFETLARRLKPFEAPRELGVEPMFIGAAGPALPAMAPDDADAYLPMDGALRAPAGSPAELGDVPADVRSALQATLDAAAAHATGAANGGSRSPALGPPIYGAWHARRHTIPDDLPAWLRELNLDPRSRAAAGLGAEIERGNQEQFMQWCWEQVGRILEANRLMSRARLSIEVLARLHERHIAALPDDRAFALAAPLHGRLRFEGATVSRAIARSSLADAAGDPALRRLTSPARAQLRRAFVTGGGSGATPRVRMVAGLADGRLDVDPTRFVPHGLLGVPELAVLPIPAGGEVDLTATGLAMKADAALVGRLRDNTRAAGRALEPAVLPRTDLRDKGLLGELHVQRARELLDTSTSGDRSLIELLRTAREVSPVTPVTPVTPLQPPPLVGPLARRIPVPDRSVATIGRFERAIARAVPGGRFGPPRPVRTLRRFDVAGAGGLIVRATDPRTTVPARLGGMLSVGAGATLLEDTPETLTVAPTIDRVMAAPQLDVPAYEYLAALDPERFLPGVGSIPDEAITLLETNPRFVEALLVGLNDECNRELLWREFPTDQRGTPFRSFWRWSDERPEIVPIHEWPAGNGLGFNARGGPGGQIVLLVRGRILRRYPNTAVLAWRARRDGPGLKVLSDPPDVRLPVFAGVLGSDIAFAGFDLTEADLDSGDGWFFVLQEQPSEPRFGFDELSPGQALPTLTTWSDATWQHTGTAPGGWLTIAGNPLSGAVVPGARFADDAGHLAAIAFQKPFRVAVHADSLRDG